MKNYLKKVLRVGVVLSLLGASSLAQVSYAQNINLLPNLLAPNGTIPANIITIQNNIVAQACLSDKQIQQGVLNKKILPLNIVIKNAGISKNSKVLPPINVCNINGVLFYQFSILGKNGKARKLILPATAPLS